MFAEALTAELELAMGSAKVLIPGGDIERFDVELHSYGFAAEVVFWVLLDAETDTYFSSFTKPDLLTARLYLRQHFDLPTPPPDPLVVKGVVVRRSMRELVSDDVLGQPLLRRRYRMSFADPAYVLWRQHRPTMLFEDASLKEVIEANIVEGIGLEMEWPILEVRHHHVLLSLGEARSDATFYDWLLRLVRDHGGVFTFDAKTGKYALKAAKDAKGTPIPLEGQDLAAVEVVLPEVQRRSGRAINIVAVGHKIEEVKGKEELAPLKRDVLARKPVAADLDPVKAALEKSLEPDLHELELRFQRWPRCTLRPGTRHALDDRRGKFFVANKYRTVSLWIGGRGVDPDPQASYGVGHKEFELTVQARLELEAAPQVRLRAFRRPAFPVYAEGRVVCTQGKDGERTYEVFPDDKTKLDSYHVKVTAWNKIVRCPYAPDFFPGHFYFPLWRDLRVLVALYEHEAEIAAVLEWGAGVDLPLETQGNHLVLGKKRLNQTTIAHTYKDGKPQLVIHRMLEKDQQRIEVAEGLFVLEVKEEEDKGAASEKHSVKPKVEAAKAEMQAKSGEAVGKIGASFAVTKAASAGELGGAIADTSSDLDGMSGEVNGAAEEVSAEIQAAVGNLDGKVGEVKGKSDAAKAALMGGLDL